MYLVLLFKCQESLTKHLDVAMHLTGQLIYSNTSTKQLKSMHNKQTQIQTKNSNKQLVKLSIQLSHSPRNVNRLLAHIVKENKSNQNSFTHPSSKETTRKTRINQLKFISLAVPMHRTCTPLRNTKIRLRSARNRPPGAWKP